MWSLEASFYFILMLRILPKKNITDSDFFQLPTAPELHPKQWLSLPGGMYFFLRFKHMHYLGFGIGSFVLILRH